MQHKLIKLKDLIILYAINGIYTKKNKTCISEFVDLKHRERAWMHNITNTEIKLKIVWSINSLICIL
jgi:hypothetical protein